MSPNPSSSLPTSSFEEEKMFPTFLIMFPPPPYIIIIGAIKMQRSSRNDQDDKIIRNHQRNHQRNDQDDKMIVQVANATNAVANVDDYSGSARLLAATTLRWKN